MNKRIMNFNAGLDTSYINLGLWQPQIPLDAFFFDWDSTLSMIEGIDFLASLNGVVNQVHEITQRCMAVTGLDVKDYKKRLNLVQPTSKQIEQLVEQYRAYYTPGSKEVIRVLQGLGKKVYIISSGIKSAILPLARELGIPEARVFAVDIYFNAEGDYEGFNRQSNLIKPQGKALQIAKIIKAKETSLLVGDGFTDWEAQSCVTRFVGYAGVSPKIWVQDHSDFYIRQTSLLPLLALGLTDKEQATLPEEYKDFYNQGLIDIQEGRVLIKEQDNVYHTNS